MCKNPYNVLILSVGRRVELVQCFKNAAKKLNICSVIVGADCQDTAPALYFVDKAVILPRISSPDYIDRIIEVCNQHEIRLVVPTIDTDLLILASNKKKIERKSSATVLISNEKVIEICRDKWNTQNFMEKEGFKVPHMYDNEDIDNLELPFPLFIKPRDGSSSINTFKVNSREEFKACRCLINNPMVQEFIDGEEFTVDSFLDFESSIITVVPRLRLATRSGEISKGKILKDQEIIADVKRLLLVLKPIGHITVQCMKTKRGIVYIEINPRFGGGAPMSIASGADSCQNLYKLLMGEKLQYNENYRENLLFLRFDSSICLDGKVVEMGCRG